ncbi:MAG TPA: sugar transferase, partial [Steroidobacteraceae bacterium]
MVYQDTGVETIDEVEAEVAPDLPVRLWQRHPPHQLQRVLGPNEVDVTLASGGASVQKLKAASAVPLVHHVPRQPGLRAAHASLYRARSGGPGEAAKRLLDIIGALTLAVVLSPFLVVVGLVLARDRGPIIYSHSRTGRHGRTFGCLKFRTMVPNAEQVLRELLHQNPELQREWMSTQKLRNDPRVT